MPRPVPSPPFEPRRTDPCLCGSGRRFKACCGQLNPDRPPPYGVTVVRGFLDAPTCAAWVANLHGQPRKPLGTLAQPQDWDREMEIDFGSGRITDQVKAGDLRPAIDAAVHRAFSGPIVEASGREFEWFEHPQVLRYEPGGWYGTHADSELYLPRHNAWVRNIDRDMSLLLYLNDDFDGGGLRFTHFNWRLQPRRGDLVFFPSDQRYCHQAETVTRGSRWVIVSWGAFRDGPRVHDVPTPDSILL